VAKFFTLVHVQGERMTVGSGWQTNLSGTENEPRRTVYGLRSYIFFFSDYFYSGTYVVA
jgi:hypothetical protein